MSTVWKVGSRWGNLGESVLDLFLEYKCVFFGTNDDCRKGDWGAVRKGDLFVISEGSTPVAVGEALGECVDYRKSNFSFRETDCERISVDDCAVVVCPANLRLLLPKERKEYWGIDPRKRFCRAPGAADKVRRYWSEVVGRQGAGSFDIKTRAVSLADVDDKDRIFQVGNRYHIPIYQRPYSWNEDQLRKLMEDLRQGLKNDDPIFMGTIQLSQPINIAKDGSLKSYDVIDGQQRLTTFMILLSVLEKFLGKQKWVSLFESTIRTSVNKRAAQNDLNDLFKFLKARSLDDSLSGVETQNPYLRNAKIIWGLVLELASLEQDDESVIVGEQVVAAFSERLLKFVENELKIVVIETHAGLSKTLRIFNTINTSGLDLGSEDLFKVRFYEYLKDCQHKGDNVFDEISQVYEKVDGYNKKPYAETYLNMGSILSTYQRVLIGQSNLNVDTFSMSQENFFEQLFDTMLGVHEWPSFKKFSDDLTLDGLNEVYDCYARYLKACDTNPKLRIFRHLLWETRYGYVANFPVIALYFGVADERNLEQFVEGLFKVLVPASIYFQKTVSRGRTQLIDFLKAIGGGAFKYGDSVVEWGFGKWFDGGMEKMVRNGLGYEMAWVAKWKNLMCRLVEYLQTPMEARNQELFDRLFSTGFDVEHIQPYTDEENSAAVLKEWGGEINRIGNLAMFESSLNRGVQNHSEKKPTAYAQSAYRSLSCLTDKVANWSMRDAIDRREKITELVIGYLQEK